MNLGDELEVREANKRLRVSEREKDQALSAFLSNAAGREWMYDFLARLKIFHSTFSSDPYATAFQEGQRSAGLALVAEVSKACPKFYIEMLAERLAQENEKKATKNG